MCGTLKRPKYRQTTVKQGPPHVRGEKLKWKIFNQWQGKLYNVLLHQKRNYVEMVNAKYEILRDVFVFCKHETSRFSMS